MFIISSVRPAAPSSQSSARGDRAQPSLLRRQPRRHVSDESVDLVYLDPPFNSNANYNVLFAAKDTDPRDATWEEFGDKRDDLAALVADQVLEMRVGGLFDEEVVEEL